MKKTILLTMVTLFVVAGPALCKEQKLGVTIDVTYLSKWMSKGAEAYGQQGALFETIDFDFWGTGFGVEVTHRNATASGNVDKERFDYRPYYKSKLFDDKSYATNYNISCGYEHYPGLARDKANTTYEWIFAFSWPNVLPKGFIPSYIVHYEYPAGSNYAYNYVTGWVHRFGLGYEFNVQGLLRKTSEQTIYLSSELAYTDGLGGATSDWSYATFGISTRFKINDNLSFVPGLYHQISMDDSVCERHNVTYCSLSMKYKL